MKRTQNNYCSNFLFKQILLFPVMLLCIMLKAQEVENTYVIVKNVKMLAKAESDSLRLSKKHSIILKNRFYLVEKNENGKLILAESVSGMMLFVSASDISFIDSMTVRRKRKLIAKHLNKVDRSYNSVMKMNSETKDTVDIIVLARDSIYENIYSPIREQIVKSWKRNKEKGLLTVWFRFLAKNSFDDGLDAKFLTICFLKYPNEFSDIIKRQKHSIKKYIINYMTGSSGFGYATNQLGVDYDESLELFKTLIK